MNKDDFRSALAHSFTDNLKDFIEPRILHAAEKYGWGIDESEEVVSIVMASVNETIKLTTELCMEGFKRGSAEAREWK